MARRLDEPLHYYPWHWRAWRANRKVQKLDLEMKGAYHELLDEQWSEGFIPSTLAELAEILDIDEPKMQRIWKGIGQFFEDRGDGCLLNPRLESERIASDRERVERARAGRKGGKAKAMKQRELLANSSTAKQVPYSRADESREEKRKLKQRAGADRADAAQAQMLTLAEQEPEQIAHGVTFAATPERDELIVVIAWNEFAARCAFPRVTSVGKSRQRALRARIAEKSFRSMWRRGLQFLESSDWHRRNPTTIDTFLRPNRVVEYAERLSAPASGNGSKNGARQHVDAAMTKQLTDNASLGRAHADGGSEELL